MIRPAQVGVFTLAAFFVFGTSDPAAQAQEARPVQSIFTVLGSFKTTSVQPDGTLHLQPDFPSQQKKLSEGSWVVCLVGIGQLDLG